MVVVWLVLGYLGSLCAMYNGEGCIKWRKRDIFVVWFAFPILASPVWFLMMGIMRLIMWLED